MITALDQKTALVLIDLQKGIMKMEKAHPIEKIVENVILLIDQFRKAELPIAIVNVNPTGSASAKARVEGVSVGRNNGDQSKSSSFLEGFDKIIPELKTTKDDIFITKKTWSAFYNTKLHEELQKRGITGIVLGGVATSVGVEGTARAASELGYNISFAKDAMTDTFLEAHERSLKYIFPKIGEIGTTKDIIDYLKM